jgi:HAD superfamily hydrolase (TIGR01549 family)
MRLAAVSLDLGHTLVFEQPSRHAIYAEAARLRGLRVTDEAMRDLMRRANQELPDRLDGAYRYTDRWFGRFIERIFHGYLEMPAAGLTDLTRDLFARFESQQTFRLFPGALELLAGIRDLGLPVGLVSNWSARLPRLLDNLELADRFDFVLCSALEGVEKPDPRLFLKAAELAGVRPEQLLHAGDREHEDGGALDAGCQAVLVESFGPQGLRRRPELPRVSDLTELLRFIRERR